MLKLFEIFINFFCKAKFVHKNVGFFASGSWIIDKFLTPWSIILSVQVVIRRLKHHFCFSFLLENARHGYC